MDWGKLETFDRRWIFLAMGLSVLIPLLFPLNLPFRVQEKVERVYEAIEAVEKAMEDMAEHDRSNARERAARAALARFDGDSPSKVSANVAAPTDKTGLSGSIQPEIWKLVTPTDEDEDELAECIREGFASSEGGAYEATRPVRLHLHR